LAPTHQLRSLGERCKLPQWGLGGAPTTNTFWTYTKSLENMSNGRKCRTHFIVFTEHRRLRNSRIPLAEPLGSAEPRLKNTGVVCSVCANVFCGVFYDLFCTLT